MSLERVRVLSLQCHGCRPGEAYPAHQPIGERTPAGVFVVADYTAPAKGFHSMTTSKHVNLTKYQTGSAVIMNPLVWECSPMSESKPF